MKDFAEGVDLHQMKLHYTLNRLDANFCGVFSKYSGEEPRYMNASFSSDRPKIQSEAFDMPLLPK